MSQPLAALSSGNGLSPTSQELGEWLRFPQWNNKGDTDIIQMFQGLPSVYTAPENAV